MRVTISKEHRNKLNQEAERTGMGPSKLLRGKRGIAPEGLTSSMIHGWKSGTIRTAKKEHLDWVIQAYAEWTPPAPPDVPEKIILTDEHRALIQSEVKRTGLGAVAILRHAPKPLPEGLSHQKVQRWISGTTTTAQKAQWDYIVNLYLGLGRKTVQG